MTNNIRDILNVRQSTHGDYSEHSRITQNLKAMMHDTPNWSRLSADQIETLEMIAHKVGRILAGNPEHDDHWDDIAGYSTLTADRVRERARPATSEDTNTIRQRIERRLAEATSAAAYHAAE